VEADLKPFHVSDSASTITIKRKKKPQKMLQSYMHIKKAIIRAREKSNILGAKFYEVAYAGCKQAHIDRYIYFTLSAGVAIMLCTSAQKYSCIPSRCVVEQELAYTEPDR